jgi:hypothetical protein
MKTVKKMIEELKNLPEDAGCYGYQGEASGLGIKYKGSKKWAFIPCGETEENEDDLRTEYWDD